MLLKFLASKTKCVLGISICGFNNSFELQHTFWKVQKRTWFIELLYRVARMPGSPVPYSNTPSVWLIWLTLTLGAPMGGCSREKGSLFQPSVLRGARRADARRRLATEQVRHHGRWPGRRGHAAGSGAGGAAGLRSGAGSTAGGAAGLRPTAGLHRPYLPGAMMARAQSMQRLAGGRLARWTPNACSEPRACKNERPGPRKVYHSGQTLYWKKVDTSFQ